MVRMRCGKDAGFLHVAMRTREKVREKSISVKKNLLQIQRKFLF
jgi:hypothetical protein